MSPFSLFNQKPQVVNPLKISLASPSTLNEKISTIGQPTSIENPLQDFIKSLSSTGKPEPMKSLVNSQFSAEIVRVIDENKEFKTLRIKRPDDWVFLPGQYLEVRAENSSFSDPVYLAIASGIDDEYIEITAKPSSDPEDSNYCLNSDIGQYLSITGPLGTNFPINLVGPDTPVLMLGGGSGLTALKSVKDSLPWGTEAKMIYSSKSADELIYKEEIEKWKEEGHTISLTRDKVEGFQQGRITDHLVHLEIKPNTLIFICGPEELVLETTRILAGMGVPRELIFGSLPATAEEGGPVYRGDQPEMMVVDFG